jgi:hypothetical protein
MPPQSPSLSPTLLECRLEIVHPWRVVFAQQRTFLRAVRQGLSWLLCLGRSTLSRIIRTTGREQKSWSGEYFLHSRAERDPHALFEPMVREALSRPSGGSGRRRYSSEEDGPRDPAGAVSSGPALASLPRQLDPGTAFGPRAKPQRSTYRRIRSAFVCASRQGLGAFTAAPLRPLVSARYTHPFRRSFFCEVPPGCRRSMEGL